jgi:RimJ/RimL family protein N-acetyltransferase
MQLRSVEPGDHEWLVELHNDPEVLHNLTDPQPITMDQHMAWWDRTCIDPQQLRLIFTVNDERVGFTKFYNIDRVNHNCVLGADIHHDHRGKGYAKNMWAMMLNVSFLSLQMYRVSLTTAEYNAIGQRVYRALGFKEEGRLVKSLYRDGAFHDQLCMYMLRDDWLHGPSSDHIHG